MNTTSTTTTISAEENGLDLTQFNASTPGSAAAPATGNPAHAQYRALYAEAVKATSLTKLLPLLKEMEPLLAQRATEARTLAEQEIGRYFNGYVDEQGVVRDGKSLAVDQFVYAARLVEQALASLRLFKVASVLPLGSELEKRIADHDVWAVPHLAFFSPLDLAALIDGRWHTNPISGTYWRARGLLRMEHANFFSVTGRAAGFDLVGNGEVLSLRGATLSHLLVQHDRETEQAAPYERGGCFPKYGKWGPSDAMPTPNGYTFVSTGVRAASGEVLCFTDLDGQTHSIDGRHRISLDWKTYKWLVLARLSAFYPQMYGRQYGALNATLAKAFGGDGKHCPADAIEVEQCHMLHSYLSKPVAERPSLFESGYMRNFTPADLLSPELYRAAWTADQEQRAAESLRARAVAQMQPTAATPASSEPAPTTTTTTTPFLPDYPDE